MLHYLVKKFLYISFAFLILLSGMHFSIATHICGGKIAAVKWSFTGKKATCGMEDSKSTIPDQNTITSNCCRDKVSVYSVDNNYYSSSYQFKEVTKKLLHSFYVPLNLSFHTLAVSNHLCTKVIPPGNSFTSMVTLSDICVFRI